MTVVLFEPHLDDAVLLRFLDRICIGDADQCWEWTGAKTVRGGYGCFRLGTKTVTAHRWFFQRWHGVSLERNQLVLHSCDNPPCCNPHHLSMGDHQRNAVEASERGLLNPAKAERNANSKLSAEKAAVIRSLYRRGEYGYKRLAREFAVDEKTIRRIISGRTWA